MYTRHILETLNHLEKVNQDIEWHKKKIDELESDNKTLNECIKQAEDTVKDFNNLEAKLEKAEEFIDWLWENEPEKEGILDKIRKYITGYGI